MTIDPDKLQDEIMQGAHSLKDKLKMHQQLIDDDSFGKSWFQLYHNRLMRLKNELDKFLERSSKILDRSSSP